MAFATSTCHHAPAHQHHLVTRFSVAYYQRWIVREDAGIGDKLHSASELCAARWLIALTIILKFLQSAKSNR
jgi:hypothetical protein